MTLAEAIAAIFAKAIVQEVLERFPEIIAAYQRAMQVHVVDAENPAALQAKLRQQEQHETQ